MQRVLTAILVSALVLFTGQAKFVQGADLKQNFVSQMSQIPSGQARRDATDPIPEKAGKLNLTTLATAIQTAGLKKKLEGKGPFTLFGPTNEAFKSMPNWAKEAIKNKTVLARYLKFHAVKGKVKSGDLKNELLAETLLGYKVRVNIYKKGKEATVTAQCAAINLTRVDNQASNGVIHVLENVMIPPGGDAFAVLAVHKEFSTLVKLLKIAGLAGTLGGDGPYTIFAPVNQGFGILPPGTLEKWMKNPLVLAKFMKYHLLAGTVCSRGLTSGDYKTVEGQNMSIDVSAKRTKINGWATVTETDWSLTNGVIHVIDTVLLTPDSLF